MSALSFPTLDKNRANELTGPKGSILTFTPDSSVLINKGECSQGALDS